HRLRVQDAAAGATPVFEMPVAQIANADMVVLVGCDPRREMPLLAHRVRQAFRRGARVYAINPVDFDMNFGLEGQAIVPPSALVDALLALARDACAGKPAAADMAEALAGASSQPATQAIAAALA